METFIWGVTALVALAFARLVWRERYELYYWLRTGSPPDVSSVPASNVMSPSPDLWYTILVLQQLHAWNARAERERAGAGIGNERDISANRRAALKKMLDRERQYLPPTLWTNKTEFRAIAGGNTTKAGDLFDELHRELDAVELRARNAHLETQVTV
jgi:hypothetical protein